MALHDDARGYRPERSERSRDPLVGTLINGKFHVEKAIARGGMGRIYYGTQAPLDRPVALKIVKADSVNEEESQFLKRFLLEASILAKLQHPNVVTLFDYGRIEDAPVEMYFIAMEFLDGETLTERLRTRGALPTLETLGLFRQIARGLREAHARGIVHRDLKPSNIVIVPDGHGELVKLVDFGIGKIEERSGEDLTREGVLVGTPKYMAPEQFDGQSSPASDVYALGIIIYQVLTGSIPFAGNTLAEFMIAKLQHGIPALREVNPICDAPENLENLVYRMLLRRPEERPSLDEVFSYLALCEEEVFGSSGARLVLTRSGPVSHRGGYVPSSRPPSHDGLQVPYTVVAPLSMPSMTPRPPSDGASGSGALPVVRSFAPPATDTTRPQQPATPARSVPISVVLGIVVAVLVMGGGGLWFAKTRVLAKEAPASTSPSAVPSPPDSSASSAVLAPTPVPSIFVLHLDSSPPGAMVIEDGRNLGVTPIDIPIDRAMVAKGARTFQLKKEGYAGTVFAQGSAEGDVGTVVPLAPETARAVKSPPHVAGGGKMAPPGGGKTTPPVPQGESDIRLKR
jgi:serine/threonine-protein kinase